MSALSGYSEEQLRGRVFSEFIHPEDVGKIWTPFQELLTGHSDTFHITVRFLHADGSVAWGSISSSRLPEAHNGQCVIGTIENITERKVAEQRLQALIETAPDALVIVDEQGTIEIVNSEAEKLFGYLRQELIGQKIEILVPERARQRHPRLRQEYFRQPKRRAGSIAAELRARRKDGSEIPVEISLSPLETDEGVLVSSSVRDISARKHGEELLRQTLALQQAILDNAKHSIVTTSPDGTIRVFNKAAEQMLGYSSEELVGRTTPAIFHDSAEIVQRAEQLSQELGTPVQPGFETFIAKLAGSDADEHEWSYVRKDGTRFPVLLAVTPLRDRDGQITGYLGIANDITEQRRADDELRHAKELAETANHTKGEFLANMSHEIRTPMNGILGMAELVLDTGLTSEQQEYIQIIRESADALLAIINDILDFSKIEAGRLELDPVDFELREKLAGAMHALTLRAQQKSIELVCHVAQDVPDYLRGDPDRLRQIIVNLLGNAIKFTEHGEVVMRVECHDAPEGDADTCLLHFSVADTGIGIPAEKQRIIFDAFTQADSSTTRRFGGTGLGLTIVSQLVRLMGGQIWVESEVGHGSTFHFTAEFRRTERKPNEEFAAQLADLQGIPVLVVDDNATNRRVLHDILSNWHMRPTLCSGGAAGLAAARDAAARGEPFALAIVDYLMPEMDGLTLIEEFRNDPALSSTMIVMLSSAGDREAILRCRELGVVSYVCKPIFQSELLRVLVQAYGQSAAPRSHAAAVPKPSPDDPKSAGSVTDDCVPRPLRILLAEDNAINQRVAVRLLEKAGHTVTVAENGQAALDALRHGQFDVVLMDLQMPQMDGLEATAAIRADEQADGRHMPIIAMTAHAMKEDRKRCLAAGMDDYISKPVDSAALRRALAHATASPAPPPIFDQQAAVTKVDGDLELLRELATMLRDDAPQLVAEVRGAVTAHDASRIEKSAHRLKGSMMPFCALQAVQAAQALETLGHGGDLSQADERARLLEAEVDRLLAAINSLISGNETSPNAGGHG